METHTLLLFTATVLPLICTPGPDMLFVTSQAISGGTAAGLRATTGVCLGYVVHSALVALGIAVLVAASPVLFEALRWTGIVYLVYLACKLIGSALSANKLNLASTAITAQVRRGFLTAVLNPKGMMIYFAILPQFIHPGGSVPLQAAILSAAFIFWCGTVYTVLSLAIGRIGSRSTLSDRRRRMIEGGAGGMLIAAAVFMAGR
ncbi:LysE family translocator [Phyllobacterium sp. 628]|uniref:LysE family translocator n=1 Tax=Phyllobacterium sp. 628 TaxID=2718938 RepID=UPI00166279FF|nr:LysE family translocator [Phyllobacterium sp. 628]QND51486.1 LysE family translocator [Phyllobacterium sp. 628]